MKSEELEDIHFIDDPLVVVGVKPDFSGIWLNKKPEKKSKPTNKYLCEKWVFCNLWFYNLGLSYAKTQEKA